MLSCGFTSRKLRTSGWPQKRWSSRPETLFHRRFLSSFSTTLVDVVKISQWSWPSGGSFPAMPTRPIHGLLADDALLLGEVIEERVEVQGLGAAEPQRVADEDEVRRSDLAADRAVARRDHGALERRIDPGVGLGVEVDAVVPQARLLQRPDGEVAGAGGMKLVVLV